MDEHDMTPVDKHQVATFIDNALIDTLQEQIADLRAQIERLQREAVAGHWLAMEILATNRELTDGHNGTNEAVNTAQARIAFALVAWEDKTGHDLK